MQDPDHSSGHDRLRVELAEVNAGPSAQRSRGLALPFVSVLLVAAVGIIIYLIIKPPHAPVDPVIKPPLRPEGALSNDESLLTTVMMGGHWTEVDLLSDDKQKWTGSGVVIGEDRGDLIIMTNRHCIALPSIVAWQPETPDIKEFVIGVKIHSQSDWRRVSAFAETRADGLDLALLRLPKRDLVAGRDYVIAPIASRARASRGGDVVAIGAPLQLRATETFGRISALRPVGEIGPNAVLQTDAAISPGNSGGPLFVADGGWRYLVAINTFALQGGENLNFAYYADEYQARKWEWFTADPVGAVKALRDLYNLEAEVAQ